MGVFLRVLLKQLDLPLNNICLKVCSEIPGKSLERLNLLVSSCEAFFYYKITHKTLYKLKLLSRASQLITLKYKRKNTTVGLSY